MNLLIFFAFPIATIIISIILQKIIRNPFLVAAFIFAVFLIVAFAAFDETFLVAVLIYTIIALITALIVCIFCNDDDHENSICDTISDILNNNSNINENSCQNNNSCGCNNRSQFRRR